MEPRVAIVANPSKRRIRRVLAAVSRAVDHAGWLPPLLFFTTPDEPGGPQAARALDAGADCLLVLGGDGTVREVAHVLGSAGRRVPLGIVPIGTANLFARNLRLPWGLEAAVRVALHGPVHSTDLGYASLDDAPPRAFLVVAGIGEDAATVLHTRDSLKRTLLWGAYFESGARHLWRPPTPMRVSADGRDERVEAWTVLAGTCGRIPPGIDIFPGLRPGSGVLHTLAVAPTSPWQWGAIAAGGMAGVPHRVPWLRYGRASSLIVEPSRPLPAHIDGDAVPEVNRLAITLSLAALDVRVPASPATARTWHRTRVDAGSS